MASSAASFDCKKASTSVEKLICTDPKLSELDTDLAQAYRGAVKVSPDVKVGQKQWLKERNACVDVTCLKTAYENRINNLNLIAQANVSGAGNEKARKVMEENVSNVLFSKDGFWASDGINKSGLDCKGVLASGSVLKRYTPSLMTIQLGLPTGVREISVPTTYENMSLGGSTLRFDRYDRSSNGALLGGSYELDLEKKTIRQIKSHTCQNCGESQLRVHEKNRNGSSLVEYWCRGNY
jgi:uncharacterized protein/ssDNA-binding Zn-finger/Zn-ribbon topoisomerase 1